MAGGMLVHHKSGRVDQRGGGVEKIVRRSHKNRRLELTHLQGLKQVFDQEESLQAVDGRQEHDDGFLSAAFRLLAAETDVQVQVCPVLKKNTCRAKNKYIIKGQETDRKKKTKNI